MEGVESDGNGKAPYYFMYASILGLDSEKEIHLLRDGKTRSTTGSIVSSIYNLKDTEGRDGSYFIFPDLSVRMEGAYRLKFSMYKIVDSQVLYCTSIISDSFNVYPAKKFPGMEESTPLSKTFAEQGLKIRIRKEVRSRAVKTKFKEVASDPPPKKRLRTQNYDINYESKDTESENESINEPSTNDSKMYDEPKPAKNFYPERPTERQYPPYERALFADRPPLERPYDRPPYTDPVRPPYTDPARPPYTDSARPPYSDSIRPYTDPVRPPYADPVRPPYADPVRPPYHDPSAPYERPPYDRDRPYSYSDPRERPPYTDPRERPPYPVSKPPYGDYKPNYDYRDRPAYPRYERPYYDPYSRPPYPYYYPEPYYSYYPPPPPSHSSSQLRSPNLFPPHHPGAPPPTNGHAHPTETNNLPPIQYFNEYKSPTPSDKSNEKERRLPPISAYHPRYEAPRQYPEGNID
ncbi:hypothetical protein HDV01_006199 [Terramyces sp. JEL0728]|nr:hypothetical protein HDV01_006199 [Terramyces sp. JEL0728]